MAKEPLKPIFGRQKRICKMRGLTMGQKRCNCVNCERTKDDDISGII